MSGDVMVAVITEWLPHLGAPQELAEELAVEVSAQIAGLPAPLRLGVGGLQWGLDLLPAGSVAKLQNLPGTGEYVRLVRSLTTVVYLARQGDPA